MATRITARQWPLVALVELTIANIGTGNEVEVSVPPGAYLYDITALTVTAVNSGTTATLSASDGTSTFISAEDVKTAAGVVAVDLKQKFYPSGGVIKFSLAETGTTATAGRILATVTYGGIGRDDRHQE